MPKACFFSKIGLFFMFCSVVDIIQGFSTFTSSMDIKLNHANVIPLTIKWKYENNIASSQLKDIVQDMISSKLV